MRGPIVERLPLVGPVVFRLSPLVMPQPLKTVRAFRFVEPAPTEQCPDGVDTLPYAQPVQYPDLEPLLLKLLLHGPLQHLRRGVPGQHAKPIGVAAAL